MSGPFKMRGSPMKRNFGIGASPAKQDKTKGPIMPKSHPVTLPTEEQSKKDKGTVETTNLAGKKKRDTRTKQSIPDFIKNVSESWS
jgi:hypothetical protein